MFNIFGRNKTAKEFIEEAKEAYIVPEVTPPKPKEDEVHYWIGNTGGDRVAFKIGNSGYTATLTMNATGLKAMIHQLQAALDVIEPEDTE